jgi:flagellar motor switch protein FliM
MADEVLSAAERELLAHRAVASTNPRSTSTRSSRESHVRPAAVPLAPLDDAIRPHDFQHPRVLEDHQIEVLSSLHERVARGFALTLSTVVRCPAQVKLSQFNQTTYGQWLREVESPACLSVVRTAQQFLSEVAKSWREVAPLTLSVQRVESDPHSARIVLPGECVVRAKFEVAFASSRGTISFCLPATVLRKLSSDLLAPPRNEGPAGSPAAQQMTQQLNQAQVEIVARLAPTRMATSELLELRVGDVIVTNHEVHRPLEVAVEGRPKFAARAGAHQGRKAVRIDVELDAPNNPPPA